MPGHYPYAAEAHEHKIFSKALLLTVENHCLKIVFRQMKLRFLIISLLPLEKSVRDSYGATFDRYVSISQCEGKGRDWSAGGCSWTWSSSLLKSIYTWQTSSHQDKDAIGPFHLFQTKLNLVLFVKKVTKQGYRRVVLKCWSNPWTW